MLKKLISYSLLFVLSGCMPYTADVKPSKSDIDYFRMLPSEQIRQFTSHRLEEQYHLYLVGNQIIEPPAIYLAKPFAEQGPVIVPFLKTKLIAAKEEISIRDISLIFRTMAELKLYDFSTDHELMHLLDERSGNMHGIWKDITLKNISGIRSVH